MDVLQNCLGYAARISYFADLTFGRDGARYRELITFMAVVSIVLWVIVLVTTLLRIGMRFIWYRRYLRSSEAKKDITAIAES